MKPVLPLHTLLLALYFPLFLFSQNVHRFPVAMAAGPAVVILSGTMIAWLVGCLAFRDREKSGILVSLNLIVFFTYGYAFDLLRSALESVGIANLGANKVLVAGWFLLNAAAILAMARPPAVRATARGLRVVSLILILLPLATTLHFLATDQVVRQVGAQAGSDDLEAALDRAVLPSPLPDIYHIVLDAYPRDDVLRSAYGHENRAFTDHLAGKGFRIGTASYSNYTHTGLSLASALNFNYLDSLVTGIDDESENWKGLENLKDDARSVRLLKRAGYRHIVVLNGWETSPPPLADIVLSADDQPEGLFFDEFQTGLLAMTPLPHLLRKFDSEAMDPKAQHRKRILYALSALEQVPREKGPKLVFSHILAPHGPIVLDAEGRPAQGHGETNLLRKDDPEAMKAGVVGEIRYLNRRITAIIERILATSGGNAVILLHSDHGEPVLDYQDTREYFRQRHGILCAVYLPPGARAAGFHEAITPVNLYRHVLREALGMEIPDLEERIFYSRRVSPFGLREITDSLRAR